MRLHDPWLLALLVCLPIVVWGWRRWRARASIRYSSVALAEGATRSLRQRLMPLLPVLRLAALAALVVAIARPQSGVGRSRVSTEGVALMMVVDRSGSMREPMAYEGREMTRLDVVKRVFQEFVLGDGKSLGGRRDDLVGLVTFARYADTACPLVRDTEALSRLTDRLQLVTTRSEDGTAIGDAIALAAARLKRAEEDLASRAKQAAADAQGASVRPDFLIRSKAIILLTDGHANYGNFTPEQAAALAKEWGIRIYAIGIGGSAGSRSGADEPTLFAVADVTGGKAWRASDADTLRQVYAEIDQLEKTKIESLAYTEYDEEFAPLALGALGVLLLEGILGASFLRRTPA